MAQRSGSKFGPTEQKQGSHKGSPYEDVRFDSSQNLWCLEQCLCLELNTQSGGVRITFGVRTSVDGRTVRAEAEIEFVHIHKFWIDHLRGRREPATFDGHAGFAIVAPEEIVALVKWGV